MSIELFPLNASVSSGVVSLSWSTNVPGFPPTTGYSIQRKLFGYAGPWTVVSTSPTVNGTALSYSETPGAGDWSYQVVASVTQGGVDSAATNFNSQQVNVTTEATTGVVTLVLGSLPAGDPANYTRIKLGWYISPLGTDVESWLIERSLNGGTSYHEAGEVSEFNAPAFEEVLQNGTGAISYRVTARLPSATPPYNAPVLSVSNVVTVTI